MFGFSASRLAATVTLKRQIPTHSAQQARSARWVILLTSTLKRSLRELGALTKKCKDPWSQVFLQ
jgi:hypothetical protein